MSLFICTYICKLVMSNTCIATIIPACGKDTAGSFNNPTAQMGRLPQLAIFSETNETLLFHFFSFKELLTDKQFQLSLQCKSYINIEWKKEKKRGRARCVVLIFIAHLREKQSNWTNYVYKNVPIESMSVFGGWGMLLLLPFTVNKKGKGICGAKYLMWFGAKRKYSQEDKQQLHLLQSKQKK